MTRILAAILLALLCPAPGHAQDTFKPTIEATPAPVTRTGPKIFNAQSTVLENGLQVVVIPNHRAPVVTQMVWYKVGAADEQWGKSGIAHFLEHLMFKGSEGLKAGEFSEKIRALGGNDNAFTGNDYTAYFQSIAAEHLETVMTMEAGRMRGMALPPEQVDSERLVILEERRQRTDNNPGAQLNEQLGEALYTNHHYGIPIIGWLHEMETLTREDAKAFYDQWYGPNNAILVVAGDVTPEQVFALAEKIYGKLPRTEVPERKRTIIPPAAAPVDITLRHATIREPEVQVAFRVPSYRQNSKTALALQVLEEIMGGGSTSRLYRSLVVEQKIASSAALSYRPDMWDEAGLWVYASPLPGIEPVAVQKALQDELRKLIAGGITEQELNDARQRMQSEAIYALDSLTGPAMIFGQGLTTGSSIDDIEYWPQDIAAVTAEQVVNAARIYLNPDDAAGRPPVTGYLLPKEKVPAAQPEPEVQAP